MKILVMVLIIPFVPFLLAVLKIGQTSSFIRTWFSEFYVYFTKLIRSSVLVYGLYYFASQELALL